MHTDENQTPIFTPPSGAPRVLNKKTEALSPNALYVGRPSRHGNPFAIGRDGTREQVVNKHLAWLAGQDDLADRLCELRGRDLVCHCSPELCHAHTLIFAANPDLRNPAYWRDDIFALLAPIAANADRAFKQSSPNSVDADMSADDMEPQNISATAALLDELALYGAKPGSDETDHRLLPSPEQCEDGIAGAMNALFSCVADSRLEDDAEDLLWAFVNIFHRKLARIEKALDANEDDQRRLQREQDGSEVKSVELERAVDEGMTLLEQQNAYTAMRDMAADKFRVDTGSIWRPASGSRASASPTTSALIDSKDFIGARRRRRDEALNPQGPIIAFAGGKEFQDVDAVFKTLDACLKKHPDMVLAHGGTKQGAELIAAKWADARKVAQIVFQPDWKRHNKAAPFKRNDRMLEQRPIGVIAFPGSGIVENLVDKAVAKGIPVVRGGAS